MVGTSNLGSWNSHWSGEWVRFQLKTIFPKSWKRYSRFFHRASRQGDVASRCPSEWSRFQQSWCNSSSSWAGVSISRYKYDISGKECVYINIHVPKIQMNFTDSIARLYLLVQVSIHSSGPPFLEYVDDIIHAEPWNLKWDILRVHPRINVLTMVLSDSGC